MSQTVVLNEHCAVPFALDHERIIGAGDTRPNRVLPAC